MEFGFGIPSRGPLARREAIGQIVRKAEALGFGYLSVSDHVVMPRSNESTYPYSRTGVFPSGGEDFLEQLTLLSYLAGVTEKARLVTSVMVVPHRQPVLAAKMLATADVLTGGRIVVGCGAGWLAEEFAALNLPPFAERGKVTDEYLQAFKALWTEEVPKFEGRYVNFSNIYFEPKPVQKPHPPLWIGGESPAALRRVARLGDVWFPIGSNPKFPLDTIERFRDGVARLKATAVKQGRDPGSIGLAYWANWYQEDKPRTADTGERHLLSGSAQEVADDIRRLRDAGVKQVLVAVLRGTLADTMTSIERFAGEVIPKVG